jgi:hypothetical protein
VGLGRALDPHHHPIRAHGLLHPGERERSRTILELLALGGARLVSQSRVPGRWVLSSCCRLAWSTGSCLERPSKRAWPSL